MRKKRGREVGVLKRVSEEYSYHSNNSMDSNKNSYSDSNILNSTNSINSLHYLAILALNSVGSPIASSNELVWSDCVPPIMAAMPSTVVRTMLLYGSCSVSE